MEITKRESAAGSDAQKSHIRDITPAPFESREFQAGKENATVPLHNPDRESRGAELQAGEVGVPPYFTVSDLRFFALTLKIST